MAAELKRDFGVTARRTFDKKTRFEIRLDGRTVFSASECGHLPKPGEVTETIRKLDGAGSGGAAD